MNKGTMDMSREDARPGCWLVTTKTMGMCMRKSLPGLENFYMTGQWVEVGGGLPAVAMSSRNVIQIIGKRDK
jgi:phytoene dehydrogenase-like protein